MKGLRRFRKVGMRRLVRSTERLEEIRSAHRQNLHFGWLFQVVPTLNAGRRRGAEIGERQERFGGRPEAPERHSRQGNEIQTNHNHEASLELSAPSDTFMSVPAASMLLERVQVHLAGLTIGGHQTFDERELPL